MWNYDSGYFKGTWPPKIEREESERRNQEQLELRQYTSQSDRALHMVFGRW